MSEDEITFLEEDAEEVGEELNIPAWQVLVVDDDDNVHQSTRFMLGDVQILGAPLEITSCYSGKEAAEYLATHEEPAVILLDVVMETDSAGLDTAELIRSQLGYQKTRIILRTGQAGYAPELEVINKYDINDYRVKSDLSQTRLITSLTSALRSYQQIQRLDTSHQGLQAIIRATRDLMSSEGFEQFANGVLTQIGSFLDLSPTEGMVIVSIQTEQSAEQPAPKIIAATGQYSQYLSDPLADQLQDKKQALIDKIIEAERNEFSETHTELVCQGKRFRMLVYVNTSSPVSPEKQQLLNIFSQNMGIMADNLNLIERLNQQAYFNPLTRLPNQLSFAKSLDKISLEERSHYSILVINIDRFSNIQGVLGHELANLLVVKLANELGIELGRLSQYYAQLGDDCFAFVIRDDTVSPRTIELLLNKHFYLNDLYVNAMSTAIIFRLGGTQSEGRQIISAAFTFLKDAKASQRRKLTEYSLPELENSLERIFLLQELANAIKHKKLQMYYQPKWHVKKQCFWGMEALIRWRKDSGEFVSPAEFIPMAESSGMAGDLFSWIIEAVFSDYKALCETVPSPGSVAINMSATQVTDLTIIDQFKKLSEQYGVDCSNFNFEITESATMNGNAENALELLNTLREMGATIALDDFGTGYSSLSYLSSLPVDILKLDRSFVRKLHEPDGEAIITALINLSHALGLHVVAEGVETEEEASKIARLGADSIQGYLYAKPMPVEAVIELLTTTSHRDSL